MKNLTILIFILCQFLTVNIYSQCGNGEFVVLNSQSKVDSFLINYCDYFSGTLVIADDNDGVDNIVSLLPLSSLKGVLSPLRINSNQNLTSLIGLDSLNYVGALWLSLNPLLKNLDGLNNLKTINGDLSFFRNDSLLNLDALNSLTNIASGFGSISIQQNMSLQNLVGLSSLTSNIGAIRISGNSKLKSLYGLHNLRINPNSSNLLIDQIIITHNGLLTTCNIASICEALSNDNTTHTIGSNGNECSFASDIKQNCITSSTQPIRQSTFSTFPNPFLDAIYVESSLATELIIFNSVGQQILQMNIYEGTNKIDLSNLSKGVYMIRTSDGYVKKIIKK